MTAEGSPGIHGLDAFPDMAGRDFDQCTWVPSHMVCRAGVQVRERAHFRSRNGRIRHSLHSGGGYVPTRFYPVQGASKAKEYDNTESERANGS